MTAKRSQILTTAVGIINGDRQDAYGTPQESFGRIGKLWSVLLGVEIEPWQVAQMMAALKLARSVVSPEKDDTWVDLAGYSALAAELAPAKDPVVNLDEQPSGDGYSIERTALGDVLVRTSSLGGGDITLHAFDMPEQGRMVKEFGSGRYFYSFLDGASPPVVSVWRQVADSQPERLYFRQQQVARDMLSAWVANRP